MFYDLFIYLQYFYILMILISLSYKFMLIILMMIEFMVVNVSLLMFMIFSMEDMEFFLIYYLVFSVCEGVLGLSLLVMNVRIYGGSLYYLMNMNKF